MRCNICNGKLKVFDKIEVVDNKYCHKECVPAAAQQKNLYSSYSIMYCK